MSITVVEVVSAGPQGSPGTPGASTHPGGDTGQSLRKISETDYDVDWEDVDATDVVFTSTGDLASTNTGEAIDETNDNIGLHTLLTGIVSIEDIVSLNDDVSLIDIIPFDYFIQGVRYTYAGITGTAPTIAASDSSTWVGITATEIVYSDSNFTREEARTTLSLARLQAVQGDSGPGSDLQSPLHLTYSIGENGFVDNDWVSSTIGALYGEGGKFSENSINAFQVDQTEGSFHTAQKKHINITGGTSIQASAFFHVASAPFLQTRSVLTIPKYWDNGTDAVALDTDKYASHTLLRSPKAEDVFIFIYSNAQYISQLAAENAAIDFTMFTSQASSGFIPVARFIVKGDSTNIVSIMDERPSIIDRQLNRCSVANIQQTYDNSETPELLTDATRGALTIKRGSAADTDNILEGLNGAGDTTFSVDGNGVITGDFSLADHGDLAGIQGGDTDDYQHLTTAQVTALNNMLQPNPLICVASGVKSLQTLVADTPEKLEWMDSFVVDSGGSDISAVLLDNQFTILTTGIYKITEVISFIAPVNDIVSLGLYIDNLPTGESNSTIGRGTDYPVTLSCSFTASFSTSDEIDIFVTSDGTAITLQSSNVTLEKLPY